MEPDYRLGLGITEDHTDLADSVAGFAQRHCTPAELRAAVEQDEKLPAFWTELAAQGLLGLHIGERHGGQGGGLLELAVALEPIGRTAAPGPLVATVLTAAVLAADDGKAAGELLPGLVDGSVRGTVALSGEFTGARDDSGAITVHGSGAALSGVLAEFVVLPVEVGADRLWVVADATELTVRAAESVDVTRKIAIVSTEGTAIPADRVLDNIDNARIEAIAAVILGAEAVGITSWCVSTAVDYAKVRVQFGRPIAMFQGVKHRCAQAGILLEQARAAVWDAARALDAGEDTAAYAAAVAALVAPDAAVRSARDAMQILGGIGYTWEHDAHLYYRRALALRGLVGRSRDWAPRIARLALEGQSRDVRIDLPQDSESYRHQVRTELAEIAALDEREQLVRLGDDGWVMPFLIAPFGRNAGPAEQIVIAQEMERAGITTPQLGLAAWLMPSIAAHGTEEQRANLVAPTLRSEIVWCQMFSEPEAGSDLAALRTEAVKVDGGWRINGQKIWTSLGFIAEWGVLLARSNPNVPKHQGITYFVVDMQTEGITVRPLREASGGTLFSEIFFDNVFIPDSGVVGAVDGGWQVARGTLSNERVTLGKGLALNAGIDDLLTFVRKRGAEQVPLDRVGELVAENQTLQLLGGRTVLKQLRGTDVSATANVAKYLSMRFGQQVADFCHAELGAAGVYDQADPLSGRWIEQTISARPMTVYGGTTEVQLNVIGERVLGLPRDPEPATDAKS